MKTVPRQSKGSRDGAPEKPFGEFMRELLRQHGYSIEAFRKRYGVALQRNVLGEADFTREKVQAVLRALKVRGKAAERVWNEYVGQPDETIASLIRAGIRRYGMEALARMAGCGVQTLSVVLHGDPRLPAAQRIPCPPSLSTWRAIANALGVPQKRRDANWREDVRRHLREHEGRNPFGVEVELLFREHEGVSQNRWRQDEDRPPSLRGLSSYTLEAFLSAARRGEDCPWQMLQRLLAAFSLSRERRLRIVGAWLVVHGCHVPDALKEEVRILARSYAREQNGGIAVPFASVALDVVEAMGKRVDLDGVVRESLERIAGLRRRLGKSEGVVEYRAPWGM